jgi:hypothetical protein
MLQITKGTSNNLWVTVREKQTLTNPYFLFRFVSEAGLNREVACILTDSATYPDRINKFVFIEGTNATLDAGIWDYYVYEQTSSSNTDWRLATVVEPLEVGRAKVTGTDNTHITYASSDTQVRW